MRTQTIYRAMTGAYRTIIFTQTVDDFLHRKARQWAKFERELLRRMDHYDWYEARQRYFDACDALGIHPERREQARESARLEMNAAYKRFAAHPREQAKAAAWRKENGI